MPKSKVRKKTVYTPPTTVRPVASRKRRASPVVVPAIAVALLFLGVAWLVVFYITKGQYPVTSLHNWNLAVGFAGLVAALGVLTQWR